MTRRALRWLVLLLLLALAGCAHQPVRQLARLTHPARLAASSAGPALRIELLGDSIMWGFGTPLEPDGLPEGLRPRLGQLLAATGQPYQLRVDAVPGTSPDYWVPRIDQIMADFAPDLVVIALGTNANCVPDGGGAMQSQMTALYNSALSSRLWHVKVEPVFVTYGRSGDAPSWMVNSEPICNDAVFRAQAPYVVNSMVAGYAAWDRIPSSLLVKDGIHYSMRAYQVAAELLYDGAAATYGWPVVPLSCGLDGRRPGYPSTDGFTPCPAS